MAAAGVAAALSRTGPAIAALTVAIAAGAAIALMSSSFRSSVDRWLHTTFRADVYITSPSTGANRREGTLRHEFVERVRRTHGVAGITTYRSAIIDTNDGEVRVTALALYPPHREAFTMIEGEAARVWPAFEAGAVIVSEPFAYRHRLRVGSPLVLPTEHGTHAFTVAGIFRDYATESGRVFMDRDTWDAYWDDRSVSSIGVFAANGADRAALLATLRAIETDDRVVLVQPNQEIRDATLRVFDRTFAITSVLRGLALAVALVGVFAALMALQLERTRELGVLRATGFTPRGLATLLVAQTGLMGLVAGLLSLPLANMLAWAITHVINRRAFGWTIDLRLDASMLGQSVMLALAAALLAGVYPALRMARTRPADALREE
jgi:putative ABC transport system permease protein